MPTGIAVHGTDQKQENVMNSNPNHGNNRKEKQMNTSTMRTLLTVLVALSLAQALYAPPFVDMHNRMKECLALLGRIEKAVVRPPLMKLPAREIAGLRRALRAARVTREGWTPAR